MATIWWIIYTSANSKIAVQINGKLKIVLEIENGLHDDELENIVLKNNKIQQYIGSKNIKRVIIVPNKLVNIVLWHDKTM